jgi:hypothetical protein
MTMCNLRRELRLPQGLQMTDKVLSFSPFIEIVLDFILPPLMGTEAKGPIQSVMNYGGIRLNKQSLTLKRGDVKANWRRPV